MSAPRVRGYGRQGERPEGLPAHDAPEWIAGHIPADWFDGPPRVVVDRDEITIIGDLPAPASAPSPTSGPGIVTAPIAAPGSASETGSAGGHGAAVAVDVGDRGGDRDSDAEEAARIRWFRERTRDERIAIAADAERRYGRKIAWGATAGATSELFTVQSVPVMTRLRQPERQVLDTLVDSGVARSRSEALAWCVRLVGENSDVWLRQLREAMEEVEKIRSEGPHLQPTDLSPGVPEARP